MEWFRIDETEALTFSIAVSRSSCSDVRVGEPDVDVGRVAAGLARAGVDARDRVLDHLGEQARCRR